jgi:hypothetical protein
MVRRTDVNGRIIWAGVDGRIIKARWYVKPYAGPTVVTYNVTAGAQPAEIKVADHCRHTPTRPKPSVMGVLDPAVISFLW